MKLPASNPMAARFDAANVSLHRLNVLSTYRWLDRAEGTAKAGGKE